MQVSPETILEMPNAVLLVNKVKSRLDDPIRAIFDETENLKAFANLLSE